MVSGWLDGDGMKTNVRHAPIHAEPGFERSLTDLPLDEQRRCLVAVMWFERECPQDQRTKSSWSVDSATRRRIRAVRASKDVVVLYAVSNNGQNWIWAGWASLAESTAARIDSRAISSPEPIDVDAMLQDVKADEQIERPAMKDVDGWSDSVEETALVIAETKSLCARIRSRLADRLADYDELHRTTEVALAENARLVEATKSSPRKTSGSKDDDIESRLTAAITRYNALQVENDRLKGEVKALTKRANAATAELSASRDSVSRATAIKERMDELEEELGALKASNRKEAVTAMTLALTEEAVQAVKDQCAKLLDDDANRLMASGKPQDEVHAEDLQRLAMRVRALKLRIKM